MPAQHRWTADELRRMKAAAEGGVFLSALAVRFGCAYSTMQDLAKKHGWRVTSGGPRQTVVKPPTRRRTDKKGWRAAPTRPAFTPTESGCPVRVLQGDEFAYWKGVYEAREAEAAQRRQAYG